MGLPAGWVTNPAHELTQNQQITALGNGVLPLQGLAGEHWVSSRRRFIGSRFVAEVERDSEGVIVVARSVDVLLAALSVLRTDSHEPAELTSLKSLGLVFVILRCVDWPLVVGVGDLAYEVLKPCDLVTGLRLRVGDLRHVRGRRRRGSKGLL